MTTLKAHSQTHWRLGTFQVSDAFQDRYPEAVNAALADCAVLRRVPNAGLTTFFALCEDFEEIERNEKPTQYLAMFGVCSITKDAAFSHWEKITHPLDEIDEEFLTYTDADAAVEYIKRAML